VRISILEAFVAGDDSSLADGVVGAPGVGCGVV
jgi:hypothetical protein